jgi:hypothetical protein
LHRGRATARVAAPIRRAARDCERTATSLGVVAATPALALPAHQATIVEVPMGRHVVLPPRQVRRRRDLAVA